MSLPDQTPKLPKLPFLLGDVVLLAAAWFIADRATGPLDTNTLAAVTACVAVGALLGAIPFLTDYARKQDEALDERQRGLEALSRTINTAAEQISIAANGLNELTELTHKNLKHAEQLPHRLQEKIAEFNAQLDNAREDDREELEKELVELRAAETERLQAIAEKIHKAAGELARFDSAAQKHVTARTELIERASDTISKAHAEAAAASARELANVQARMLAEIEAKLSASVALALSTIEGALEKPASPPAAATPAANSADESVAVTTASAVATDATSPSKRPRKTRREESAPISANSAAAETGVSAPLNSESQPLPHASVSSPESKTDSSAPPVPISEPPPIPIEAITKIEPVVPSSATPFPAAAETAGSVSPSPAASAAGAPPISSSNDAASESPAIRPQKKRAAKKPAPELAADLALDLPTEETSPSASDVAPVTGAEVVERVISSDGATRLIATAYIGIGNRLFIRGDGPGLSWEKGVPLQFISIGKWRWETSDASAPIKFKLYKNDEIECSALGVLTLEPGNQQEVTTKF